MRLSLAREPRHPTQRSGSRSTLARHLTSGSIFRPNMIWSLPIAPCGSASNGKSSHGLLEKQNARTRQGISEIRRAFLWMFAPSFLTRLPGSQQLLPRLATDGPISRTPRIWAVNAFRRSSAASRECQPGASPTSSRPQIRFRSAVAEPSSHAPADLPHPLSRTQDPSLSQSRPFFACFGGTLSPSRCQIRSTRLWFTCQPEVLSNPVTMRYP